MPTYEFSERFWREYQRLTPQQRSAFMATVRKLVHDLKGDRMRSGLRIKRLQGHEDVREITWAPDGRATFSYGPSVRPGHIHVLWRRIGTHAIFDEP
jgi:hypothetical protein